MACVRVCDVDTTHAHARTETHTRTHAHSELAHAEPRRWHPSPHAACVLEYPQRYPPQERARAAPGVPPMHARGRAHKTVSFASEPIQLPIVPVKRFEPR